MSWPRIDKHGTVTVTPEGKVYIEGFTFSHASCREAAQLGMAWAMEKISAALVEDMTADSPKLSGLG